MDRPERQPQALSLMSSLMRALSHQVRTPLSVISNDLSYFKSLLPEGECQRSLDRCKQISSILGSAQIIGSAVCAEDSVPAKALLEQTFGAEVLFATEEIEGISLKLDRAKMNFALSTLLDNLREISSGPIQIATKVSNEFQITFESTYLPHLNGLKGRKFHSLHEFWNLALSSDNISIPMIDAVFDAHAISILLEVNDELLLRLAIPLV